MSELNTVIIPHFTQYPLISTKWVDYTLWTQCLSIINSGAHNTQAGLALLLPIYAAMNRGPSSNVLLYFTNLIPVELPLYTKTFTVLNPWWVTGYCTLTAHFFCSYSTSPMPGSRGSVLYYKLLQSFGFIRSISEHIIMAALAEFFNASLWTRKDGSRFELSVGDIVKLQNIVSHFSEFPLPSILSLEFDLWCKFVDLAYMRFLDGDRNSTSPETSLDYTINSYIRIMDKLEELKISRRGLEE